MMICSLGGANMKSPLANLYKLENELAVWRTRLESLRKDKKG